MIQRKKIGDTEHCRGHEIEARYMGPDLFYLDAEAARRAGRRHVDALHKEREES